jgi:hypothetical protein
MHAEVPVPGCLWYVTSLDQPRVKRDEKEAIARIIHDMFIRRHSFHALI